MAENDETESTQLHNPLGDDSNMQVVSDIPVKVTTVLGKTNVLVRRLMNMKPGNVVELDRKVGDSVDLFVNGQLIARGELVLVGTQMAVTMTEILKSEYSKP